MSKHPQTIVKVNAEIDDGIVPLVKALSDIPGLITQESCQGDAGNRHGFIAFRLGSRQECGLFLFERLLSHMNQDLRAEVALRVEAYDTDYARGWITFEASALHELTLVVQGLAASVGAGVLVARNAHRETVP